jgi:signal transduction histidine kinase
VTDDARARIAALEARIVRLEAERRRVFEDTQREADTVFAQYQLSQLLAAGGTKEEIAAAVLAEVARAAGAGAAAIWLTRPTGTVVELAASLADGAGHGGDPPGAPPRSFRDVAAAEAWAAAGGWSGVALPEGRSLGGDTPPTDPTGAVGFLAVRAGPGGELEPGHARYLASVRLELAVTLRAAQLRTSLAGEQATLAAILEGATDAIIAVDAGRRVVRLNGAAAALVGTPARVGTGMHCSEFLGCGRAAEDGRGRGEPPPGLEVHLPGSADALCGARCPFAEVLETGRAIVGREIAVRHRDGQAIPVGATVSRMPTPDGGAVGVLRDLRAGRSLDEAKTSFVAAVSHELRTPLALIDGYTQSLLSLDLDAATARRHLERIADAAGRLAALVDEIIDVSEVESDALVLRRTPVQIDGLLRAYMAERAEAPDARPVALVLPRSLPRVNIDATRIRQVIANLVQNAERHGGRAAPIEISARRPDRGTVVVTVADGGRGIAPEDRDHVFERFYRGRRVRESRVPGSGLGLYLCRRIIEAHGGWIRLDATTRGTSISVGLPVAAVATAAGPHGEIRA